MRYLIVLLAMATAGCFTSGTVRLTLDDVSVTCGPYQATPTQELAYAKLRHCVRLQGTRVREGGVRA